MILAWLIIVPVLGGILAWVSGETSPKATRWISLIAIAIDFVIALVLWGEHFNSLNLMEQGKWLVELRTDWIPQLGINFFLAMDGLSLLMILLTGFLGIVSVVASWTEIQERVGAFHFNLLWVLGGVIGVFLALDLFLFYFFWEMMLIPMYFLIAVWGHEERTYASIKFFIFTQASGLLMLVSILALYFIHYAQSGVLSFSYDQLLGTQMSPKAALLVMLGFFIAFTVKLPAVPFHTWLPDAHTEAPTAGSVILAGLLLKTGAYGLLRFVVPLFPGAAMQIAPVASVMGVIGIIYGAILAFGQNDMKRLVAYTSVSHLGFVLLGIFSWNELALQGAVVEMICHGFSTGALFIIVGRVMELTHTRDMDLMGRLWEDVPRMGAIAMFFAMASLGLPGLGNFIGEFLVLAGSFQVYPVLTMVASVGLVAGTIYSLWLIQRAFQGEKRKQWHIPDFGFRYLIILGAMIIVLVWIGLIPQPIIKTAQPALHTLQRRASENAPQQTLTRMAVKPVSEKEKK